MYQLYIETQNKQQELFNEYSNFLDGFNTLIKLNKDNPKGLFHLIKQTDTYPNTTVSSLRDNFVYDFERVPDEHINIFEIVSSTLRYNFIQIFIKPETEKISKLKYFADVTPTNKFRHISIETDGIWGETRIILADMLFNSDSKLGLWCNKIKLQIPYDNINVQLQYPLYLYMESGFDESRTSEKLFEIYEKEMNYYVQKHNQYWKKIYSN